MRNYFELLGVTLESTQEEIITAYKQKSAELAKSTPHTDSPLAEIESAPETDSPIDPRQTELETARDTLCNKKKRKEYIKFLQEETNDKIKKDFAKQLNFIENYLQQSDSNPILKKANKDSVVGEIRQHMEEILRITTELSAINKFEKTIKIKQLLVSIRNLGKNKDAIAKQSESFFNHLIISANIYSSTGIITRCAELILEAFNLPKTHSIDDLNKIVDLSKAVITKFNDNPKELTKQLDLLLNIYALIDEKEPQKSDLLNYLSEQIATQETDDFTSLLTTFLETTAWKTLTQEQLLPLFNAAKEKPLDDRSYNNLCILHESLPEQQRMELINKVSDLLTSDYREKTQRFPKEADSFVSITEAFEAFEAFKFMLEMPPILTTLQEIKDTAAASFNAFTETVAEYKPSETDTEESLEKLMRIQKIFNVPNENLAARLKEFAKARAEQAQHVAKQEKIMQELPKKLNTPQEQSEDTPPQEKLGLKEDPIAKSEPEKPAQEKPAQEKPAQDEDKYTLLVRQFQHFAIQLEKNEAARQDRVVYAHAAMRASVFFPARNPEKPEAPSPLLSLSNKILSITTSETTPDKEKYDKLRAEIASWVNDSPAEEKPARLAAINELFLDHYPPTSLRVK